jgi:transposase
MKRFVEGADRGQSTLLPECLDDWIDDENPVRVIDAFVDTLDLANLGFDGVEPAATGRPAFHPSVLLKLYIYGYLNRVQSSRRLEREAGRNVEVMWLLGRLVPDHKTIADFRKDNGVALRQVCARFVELCRCSSTQPRTLGRSTACRTLPSSTATSCSVRRRWSRASGRPRSACRCRPPRARFDLRKPARGEGEVFRRRHGCGQGVIVMQVVCFCPLLIGRSRKPSRRSLAGWLVATKMTSIRCYANVSLRRRADMA